MPFDPIKGKHGDWSFKHTPGNPDEITITFKPKHKAGGCKNIRLSQTATVVAYDKAGKVVTSKLDEMYADPDDNPFKHRKDDEITGKDGHQVAIDHLACEGDPYYNGDDKKHDTPSQGDASKKPTDPTTLTDGPGLSLANKKPNIKKIVATFETCAICVETGEILGCVSWQSVATSTDSGDINMKSDKEGKGSADFKKAFKKFIKNHSKVKLGEAKPRWHCPDTSATIRGPGGKFSDPWGQPISDGFRIKWMDERTLTPHKPEKSNMRFRFERDKVGGGQFIGMGEAIKRALESPGGSAVKFSWSGDQIKSVPSIIFTGKADITQDQLAPFVQNESRFTNDFTNVLVYPMSLGHAHVMAKVLTEFEHALANSGGLTTVTLVVGLMGDDPAGAIGQLDRNSIGNLATVMAGLDGTDDELLGAFHYLGINMGRVL